MVDVLCTSDEFEEGEVRGEVQVVDVAEYLFAFVAVLYLLEFFLGDVFCFQGFQLLPYGGFGFFQGDAGGGFPDDVEHPGIDAARNVGIHASEYLFVDNQMLDEAARTSGAQQVAQHIVHIVVGVKPVALMEDEVQGINRYVALYGEATLFRLQGFFGKLSGLYIPSGDGAEPFLGQSHGILESDVSRHSKDGIVRCIEAEEKVLHFG